MPGEREAGKGCEAGTVMCSTAAGDVGSGLARQEGKLDAAVQHRARQRNAFNNHLQEVNDGNASLMSVQIGGYFSIWPWLDYAVLRLGPRRSPAQCTTATLVLLGCPGISPHWPPGFR